MALRGIAQAIVRKGLLGDIGRNAVEVADAVGAVGGQFLNLLRSGVNASVALADPKHRDDALNFAADVANKTQERPLYTPGPGGAEKLQQLGGLLSSARRAPVISPTVDAAQQGWDQVAMRAPLLAAGVAGVANVADPFKGAGRATGSALRTVAKASDFVPVPRKKYVAAIDSARASMSLQDRLQVSPIAPDFRGRLYLTKDGKSGFGIADDGELVALFKHPESSRQDVMGAAIARGREEGATHLNAYDTYLAKGYAKRGAVERSRAEFNDDYAPEGWDPESMGRPDYVTMDLAPEKEPFTHADLLSNPGRKRDIKRYEPPRGAPAYAQRLEENEDAFKQLRAWADEGMNEEGLGWYNTEEMRQAFTKELGPEEGQRAYELYIDLVAATSAGAKTPANAKIAGHYYYNAMRGQGAPMPKKGSGYGHKAQNLHNSSAKQIIDGMGGLLEIENPKRFTFAENLKGNWDHVTVDKHNVRALGMASRDPEFLATKLEDQKVGAPEWYDEKAFGKFDPKKFSPRNFYAAHGSKVDWDQLPATWFRGAPTKTDYASLERITKRLAKEMGLTPAQAQAALWLGAGKRTGLGSPPQAFMKIFAERIKATAKRDGISQKEALKKFIRAETMLGRADPSLLAALAGGGLLAASGAAAVMRDEKMEEPNLLTRRAPR